MVASGSPPAGPAAAGRGTAGSPPDGWTRLRYIGLAGSLGLAAGAYLAGARPGLADRDGLPALTDLPWVLLCLAGLACLTAAWWRLGARPAIRGAPAPTARWMLVTAVLWAAPPLLAPPLASRDIYAYACQGALVRAGLDPHLVGPAALPCPWLDSVPPIWRDAASPYGPLFGLLSGGAAAVDRLALAIAAFRLVAIIGVVLATWYGRALARACGVPEAQAAWLGLASPLVIVHVFSGAHNDALVAGLVVAAFAVAATGGRTRAGAPGPGSAPAEAAGTVGRGLAAGVALGAAVAVKATAVVALPFLALVLAATPRLWRRLAAAALTVTSSAGLTYAALAGATGLGLGFLRGLSRTGELAQWTSVPTALGMTVGYALRALGVDSGYAAAVAVARVMGVFAAAVIVAVLWWWAWRARSCAVRRTVVAAGLALAAIAVLGPVFYPWYALAPLALLAVSVVDPKRQAVVAAASGALSFLILPNGTGLAPRTKFPGALAVTAATVVVVVRWLRGVPRRPTASRSPR